MRLSDIKGERTLDVVSEIITPIANIAVDDEASRLFKREKLPEGVSAKKFLLDRAKKSVPVLIKNHKSELITILSAIEGTTYEEYSESLNFAKLLKDAVELLTDEAFIALFT